MAASTFDAPVIMKESATSTVITFLITYFFLYSTGHFGFTAVTFLVVLPLVQVIVVFFRVTGFTASCDNLTRTVGDENVKP